MNQVYSGNYQYYQPSYQAPSSGQWAGHGYQGMKSNETFNYGSSKMSGSPYGSYTTQNAYSNQCMGRCNPPKLYADTYSYLTENLMKPVIEEVYQDLKSITAANTVANDANASKLGLAQPAQGQALDKKFNGPSQVLDNVLPMDSGNIQGQLQNVSANRQISHDQGASLPVGLANQMGTQRQGFAQPNAANRRNGLM